MLDLAPWRAVADAQPGIATYPHAIIKPNRPAERPAEPPTWLAPTSGTHVPVRGHWRRRRGQQ